MISLRHWMATLLARRRFSRVGATFEIGPGAQIRSLSIFPLRACSFRVGAQSIFAGRLSVDREGAVVSVGSRTYFGKSHLVAAKRVEIGDDVLISWAVTILDHHSHSLVFEERKGDVVNWLTGTKGWGYVPIAPVRVCNKVWIGFGATVMPGVTVGEGAIVAACAVVTKDVEPWTVVAGNPARVIKRLDFRSASDAAARHGAMASAGYPQTEKPAGEV